MLVIFKRDHTFKGFIHPAAPQELDAGEYTVLVKDKDVADKIQQGAVPIWNGITKEVEIDETTIEITREELLDVELSELWFDNMKKDLRLEEQQEEIAELWFMLMMLGGAE